MTKTNKIKITKVGIDILAILTILIIFANMASANVPTITDFQVVPSSHINRTNPANMSGNVTDSDLLRVQFGIVDINNLITYDNSTIFMYGNMTGVEGAYKSTPWNAKMWQLTNGTNVRAYITPYFVDDPTCNTICKSIMVRVDFKKNETTDNTTIFLWFSKSTGNLSKITTPVGPTSPEIESGISTFSAIRDIYLDGIDNPPIRYISNQHYILYNIGDSRNAHLISSTVPDGLYKAMARAEDTGNNNTLWTDIDTIPLDTKPPKSITSLKNITYEPDYINWTWNDPTDLDFAKVQIYINGVFKEDVLKGIRYYKATNLNPDTSYKISTHTVDTSGNINQTWRNNTARTAKDIIPPASITDLKNVTYKPNYINWTWSDPTDADFANVTIYINEVFKANVPKGTRYYNATNLASNTVYNISTHTVDMKGNINQTWVNKSAKTAKDTIPPASITGLHDTTYASTYINWTWNDPADSDFAKVLIYINGAYQTSVPKDKEYYNLTGLLSNKTYKMSTHTVDTSGNVNKTWVNYTTKTAISGNRIRFITIGDPHITDKPLPDGTYPEQARLKKIVKYINNRTDVNFVVVMGDITDDKSDAQFTISKNILKNLTKPYYVIAGNHDISAYNATDSQFNSYYGPMERIVKTGNGYQLLFVGIWKEYVGGKTVHHWRFNFSKADKTMPTLVFLHGVIKDPPPDYPCGWSESYFKYGASMQPELDKFTKLIGVYSGHVHWDSDQIFPTPLVPKVRYTSINGLVDFNIGCSPVDPIHASTKVGYSIVQDGKLNYSLVPYITSTSGVSITEIGNKYYRENVDNETLG